MNYESPKANRHSREPEEKRIHNAWRKLCEADELFLRHVLDAAGTTPIPPVVTQRDAHVAGIAIQWLGSNVGQDFLKSLGYRREP